MSVLKASSPDIEPVEVARRSYLAYVDKDRAAIEQLIAEDFHFTSPLDNQLDRKTYFERCWPNSRWIAEFEFIGLAADKDRV
jgi:ketosteroid isomerase-like protein